MKKILFRMSVIFFVVCYGRYEYRRNCLCKK